MLASAPGIQVGVLPNPYAKTLRALGPEVTYDWRFKPGHPKNTGKIQPWVTAWPLVDALAQAWTTDAHLLPYVLTNDEGTCLKFPRCADVALPWLKANGWRIRCTCVVLPLATGTEPCVVSRGVHVLRDNARDATGDSFAVVEIDACDAEEYHDRSCEAAASTGLVWLPKSAEWWRPWPLRRTT